MHKLVGVFLVLINYPDVLYPAYYDYCTPLSIESVLNGNRGVSRLGESIKRSRTPAQCKKRYLL